MTTTVIDSNSLTTFDFAEVGDTLIVASDGNLTPNSGSAIETTFGEADVVIDGSAIGAAGFFDGSNGGGDFVTVGQSGSLIGATGSGIIIEGEGSYITNAGFIEGVEDSGIESGSGSTIDNEGHIDGFYYAISDVGADKINNSGTLYAAFNQDTTVFEQSGDDTIVNSGLIASSDGSVTVYLGGQLSVVTNTGTIDGARTGVEFQGSDDYVSNSGTISALDTGIQINGGAGGNIVENSGLIETESASGTAIDFADTGDNDWLGNTGTIRGSVVFSSADGTVINSGDISGSIYFSGNDNYYDGAQGTVDRAVYCSGTVGTYIGGAHGTTFVIDAAQLVVTNTIVGGEGEGVLEIDGSGVITALDLKNVSGFEQIELGSQETMVVTEALANSAAGHALTIDTSGSNLVNLAAVTSATDTITVWGASSDLIVAGVSLDAFGFQSGADSSDAEYDTISHVNFARDKFDVSLSAGHISGINAAVTSGSLSTATFDANLAADLGPTKLSADHAVLFTASAGTLKGDTFLVIDCNNTAGYQAGVDLVIRLVGATGTLTLGNFI